MSREAARPIDRLADVYVRFRDGRLDAGNRRLAEVTGRPLGELEGATPADLFDPPHGSRVTEAVERARRTGSARVTAALRTAGGGTTRHEFVLSAGEGSDGVVVGTGRDVSDRDAREQRNRRAVRRMTDAVVTVDADWRFTFVDRRAEELYGMTEAELLGERLWEVFDEARDTPFEAEYRAAMRTRETRTLEEYFEGLDAWFRVNVYPNDDGGLSFYFRDVSERHRRQQVLEERERVLREIYEITADGERSFEERVAGLLAIGREALGTSYGTLSRIEGEEYVFEVVSADGDEIGRGDVTELSATNCERTAATEETLVLANVARDAPELTDRRGFTEWGISCYLGAPVRRDDEVYGTFCFYDLEPREDDFSEWEVTLVDLMAQWVSSELSRRATHERLASRTERLDEFASIVSHDLRNPLTVAKGRLDLAGEEHDGEHLDAAAESLDRMEALIDDLLTLAREGDAAPDVETVDLATVAERAWGAVDADDASLAIPTEAALRADEGQLEQLLVNLLRNAVDHGTTDGGSADLTVTVGPTDDGFYVADDGVGVDASDPDQVFESGYTTAGDGTGYGLTIVSRIAAAHGWDVDATESAGGGARFEVTGVDLVDA